MMDVDQINLADCAVLVVHAQWDTAALQEFLDGLIERCQAEAVLAPLVVMLPDGEWIDTLSEAQMRQHGWVRV